MSQPSTLSLVGLPILLSLLLISCKSDTPPTPEPPPTIVDQTVFIINEGQFQVGNASLSVYDPDSRSLTNQAFQAVNNRQLGDIFQSMALYAGRAYLVINNSQEIVVMDPNSLELLGIIDGLSSPRFMLPLTETKAYVSDLYADGIHIIDPNGLTRIGDIPSGPWVQAPRLRHEQMLEIDGLVYVSNYQRPYLFVIDPATDQFVDSIAIGLRGTRLLADAEGMIWVAASADFASDAPGALYRVDPASRRVLLTMPFPDEAGPGEIAQNANGDSLFYVQRDLFALSIHATALPTSPMIEAGTATFSGVGIDPRNGDVYVSDVIDFVQRGQVFRFSATALPLDTLSVGVGPMRFVFPN